MFSAFRAVVFKCTFIMKAIECRLDAEIPPEPSSNPHFMVQLVAAGGVPYFFL